MTAQLLDHIGAGAADLYIRAVCLIIGPVLGFVIYAVASIGASR